MNPGTGSRIFFRKPFFNSNGTLSMVGTLQQGSVNVPLTYCAIGCATPGTNGFNIIANPYASPVDWTAVTKTAGVTNTIYVWSHQKVGYVALTGTVGDTPPAQGGITQFLASGQGFFVEATAPGESVTFDESDKQNSSPSFGRSGNQDVIRLKVTNTAGITDYTAIAFNPNGQLGFNANEDGKKWEGAYVNISSIASGFNLAVNTLPVFTSNASIPLSVKAATAGSYTMGFEDLANVQGVDFFLEDRYNNTLTQVTSGDAYSFDITSNPASSGTGRFSLIVSPYSATGITSGVIAGNISMGVYPNPSKGSSAITVSLTGFEGNTAVISITNLLGQNVYSNEVETQTAGTKEFAINAKLPAGVYTISATQGNVVKKTRLVVE
jgi:hypothetical protein